MSGMDDLLVESFTHNDCQISIYQDPDPMHPRRECDQLGVFVDWHRRANIGDRKLEGPEEEILSEQGFDALVEHLKTFGAVAVLPVALLDHSGYHVYIGRKPHWSDSAGWDSGQVGFIYVTAERSLELCGEVLTEEEAEKRLEAEIEKLDDYFAGRCYGFEITGPDGEEVDSCWGFLGDIDYVREEAKGACPVSMRAGEVSEIDRLRAEYPDEARLWSVG